MKDLEVKKVSVSRSLHPSRALTEATRGADLRFSPRAPTRDAFRSLMQAPRHEEPLPMEAMTRVDIEVEGALPTTNYVNFWIDNHLLLGTTIDEEAQTITGFVRGALQGELTVRIEYPDGSQRAFQVRV